jgi:hypothetical protein
MEINGKYNSAKIFVTLSQESVKIVIIIRQYITMLF